MAYWGCTPRFGERKTCRLFRPLCALVAEGMIRSHFGSSLLGAARRYGEPVLAYARRDGL